MEDIYTKTASDNNNGAAAGNGAASQPAPEGRLLIADVDVGIDDAWALFMLLKAETAAHPEEHRLLGITCVAGNTSLENVAVNVARVLHVVKRTDVPVYKGASTCLINDHNTTEPPFHGNDGLGDLPFNIDSLDLDTIVRSEHAVSAIHRLVTSHPHRVTLVCCGPLTNIALAIRMYGPQFVRLVRDVHIMGGNYHGVGNTASRLCAEYNFYSDPEAAWIVLEAFAAESVPVQLLPWEACTEKTLRIPYAWRRDVLGCIDHPVVHWANPIEGVIYGENVLPIFNMCDALMVGAMLFPERLVKRARRRRCMVELQGRHTRGQVVVDHVGGGGAGGGANVTMVELLNVEAVKELFLWTVDALEEWSSATTTTTKTTTASEK